jgi:hypothetical protein
MRIFGYIYHLILGLFLLAIASIAGFGSNISLKLNMLPWEGSTLTYALFIGSLIGLVSLFLAVRGKLRLLFRLWTVVVFGLMAYGYFFTKYGFETPDHFRNALLLTLGALVAAVGSWTKVQKKA